MAQAAKTLQPKPIQPRRLSTGRYLLDNGRYIDTPERNYYRAYVERTDDGWQTRYFHGSELILVMRDDRKREAYAGARAVLATSLYWSRVTGSDAEPMHLRAALEDRDRRDTDASVAAPERGREGKTK